MTIHVEAASVASAAPPLQPEPEWVTRAADEKGWGWVRKNWQRAAAVPGAWFDAGKADAAVAQFPKWFSLTILHFAGVPFVPAFWQECIIRLIFGWKRPSEVIDPRTHLKSIRWVRLFRELRLWVPRKAGKTEFLAALALMVWYWEGLKGGEGYCFARDEKQAGQVFGRMSAMIGADDDMARDVRAYTNKLWCQRLLAPFFLITAKAEGKHGRVPYVTIGDEMHEWKSRDLADNLRQGEGPHLQPLRLYASTAGITTQAVGRDLFEESEKILDGVNDDPTVLVAIFAAAPEEDWKDEKVWARVNPNLGLTPTIDFMRQEAAKAASSPAAEAKFRCYHLNQWVEEYQRWIRLPVWDKCAGDVDGWRRWAEEIEPGRECVISFDSTEVRDFAALCWRFPPREGSNSKTVRFLWKFFLPSETIEERARAENKQNDYAEWVKSGLLVAIPGGVFELRHALAEVRKSFARWKVSRIGYDPWNANAFYTELVNPSTEDKALPEDLFLKLRFGHKTLAEPTREFERKVNGGEIEHGGNPIMRYMMRHCHVRYDENMNIVPAKKKSEKPIDGAVAAVMTEALAMADPGMGFITGKVTVL
jgi:phage terminase large subunit-like protein